MDGKTTIFPKGEKAAVAVFTGTVFVNMLVPDKGDVYNCQVYDVVFERGRGTTGTSTPADSFYLQRRAKAIIRSGVKRRGFYKRVMLSPFRPM